MKIDDGYRSRGYLPHWRDGQAIQAVTYRLADSLPREVMESLSKEEDERRRQIEDLLDGGTGACVLRNPENASIVVANWQHFDGERYHLHAWVVMPNHVHVLVEPIGEWDLATIVHSWKSYTSNTIRAHNMPAGSRRSQGVLWQREYWDRFMRDDRHYEACIRYIHANPVKARIVIRAEDWPWSSASQHQKR